MPARLSTSRAIGCWLARGGRAPIHADATPSNSATCAGRGSDPTSAPFVLLADTCRLAPVSPGPFYFLRHEPQPAVGENTGSRSAQSSFAGLPALSNARDAAIESGAARRPTLLSI